MDVQDTATMQERLQRPSYSPPRAGTSDDPPPLTFLALINVALSARYLIVALAVLSFAAMLVRGLLQPRTYSSSASFISQANRPSSNLAGIAAQLGVSVPAADAQASPAFYLDLVRSRGVLAAVAESTYEISHDTGRVVGTLDRVLGAEGATPAQRRTNTIRALRDSITANLNQRTGMVSFSVRSMDAQLSYRLASQLLDELSRFNLERRQSQAGIERRFTQNRLAEVERELRQAEDRMEAFLKGNRGDYRGSPSLTFDAERLQREIMLRQQVYNALSQSLEQAKIEEVRDTPVITVVEPPEPAASPDPRGLIRRALIAFAIGAMVGYLLAILRAWYSRAEIDLRDDVAEFSRLRSETIFDLRHPIHRLGRIGRRRAESAPSRGV